MPFLSALKYTAIASCAGLFLFMLYGYTNTKAQLAKKEYENLILLQSLQRQNEAINALKLEAQSYLKQRDSAREQIHTKYQSQPLQDSSAQSQLEAIKKDIRIWYGIEK